MYIARVEAERGKRLKIASSDSCERNATNDVPPTGAVLAVVATSVVVAGLVSAIVATALSGTAFAADDLALELARGTRSAGDPAPSGHTATGRGCYEQEKGGARERTSVHRERQDLWDRTRFFRGAGFFVFSVQQRSEAPGDRTIRRIETTRTAA